MFESRWRVRLGLGVLLGVVLALLAAGVAGAAVVDVTASDAQSDVEPAQGPSPELFSVRLSADTADAVTLRIVTAEVDADKELRAWADLDLDGAADVELRGTVDAGAYSVQAFAIAGADLDCTGGMTTSFGPPVPGTFADALPGTEYTATLDLSDTLSGPYDKATGFSYAPRVVAAAIEGPASTTAGDVAPDGAALRTTGTDFACTNPTGDGFAIDLGAGAWQLAFGGFVAEAIDTAGDAVGASDVDRLEVQAGTDQGATGAYLARVDFAPVSGVTTIGGRIYERFTVAGVPTMRMTRLMAAAAGRTRVVISDPRAQDPSGCIPGDGWNTAVDLELPASATGVVGVYLRTPDTADPASFRYAATAENGGGADVVPDLAGVAPGGATGFCGAIVDPRSLNLDLGFGLRRDDSAPTAAIAPPSPVLPGPNTFSGAASTPGTRAAGGDAVTSWEWFVGDESTPSGTGESAQLTLPAGPTTVRLRVTDAAGQVDDVTTAVDPQNLPPVVAEITQSPQTPTMGQSVTLTTSATDPEGIATGFTYSWDFDDGTPVDTSGPVVSHVFPITPASADYDVEVTVTEVGVDDPASATRTRSVHISVPTRLQIADPGAVIAGDQIRLVATVTGGDGPFRVAWDLDGGTLDYNQQPTEGVLDGGTATATVRLGAGTHTLRASATGSTTSELGTAAISVNVIDPRRYPPVATFVQQTPARGADVPLGSPVVLDAAGSRATSPALPIGALQWDFDGDTKTDQTNPVGNPPSFTVTHTYTASGVFAAGLVVLDSRGTASARYSIPRGIMVRPVPGRRDDNAPVARIEFKNPVYAGVAARFEVAVRNLRNATGRLATFEPDYRWTSAAASDATTDAVYLATFRAAGPTTVSVGVEDGFGRVGTASVTVDVQPKPPTPPTVVVSAPKTAQIGSAGGSAVVTLDAGRSTSNLPGRPRLTFAWDLDGDRQYNEGGGFSRLEYGLRRRGTHNLGVQVTDEYGNVATERVAIEVGLDPNCEFGTYKTVVSGPVKASGCFATELLGSGGAISYTIGGRAVVNGVTFIPKPNPTSDERREFSNQQRAACPSAECRAALDRAVEEGAWWIDTRHSSFGSTSPYSVEVAGLAPIRAYRSVAKTHAVGFSADDTSFSFSIRSPQIRTADKIFGFDVGSFQQLTFRITGGKRTSIYTAGVTLPGLGEVPGLGGFREFENSLTVNIDEDGVPHWDGVSLSLPELPLEFLTFGGFQLIYKGSEDLWSGEGFLRFPASKFGGNKAKGGGAGSTAGELVVDDVAIRVRLSFQNGRFKELFGRLSGINKPIGQGIFLQRIGLGVELDPFTVRGDVQLTAGPTISVGKSFTKRILDKLSDGSFFHKFLSKTLGSLTEDVAFATFTVNAAAELRGPGPRTMMLPPPTCPRIRCDDVAYTFDAPMSLKVNGNMLLVVIPIASAYFELLASDPPFIRAGGGFDVNVGVARLQAFAAGWVYGRDFNVGGQVSVEIPSIGVDVIVQGAGSRLGFAACGQLTKAISGGVFVPWEGRVRIFDGCNLAPYKTPLDVQRLTGVSPSPRATAASRAARPRAAGFETYPLSGFTLSLPSNTPQAVIRLIGDGAAPAVRLASPDGRAFEVSAAGGVAADDAMGVQDPDNNETVIAVANPVAGRWTVTGLPGSPEITQVETTGLLPEPKVKATVTTSRTKSTLRWTSTGVDSGVQLEFTEQGPGASQPIVTTSKPSGTYVFTPSRTGMRSREIYVTVSRDGKPLKIEPLATFTAPPPPRLHRVKRLRAKRQGRAVLMQFEAPKAGAQVFALELTVRSGALRAATRLSPDKTRFRVPLVNRRAKLIGSVRAIGMNGRRGSRVSVRLPARRR